MEQSQKKKKKVVKKRVVEQSAPEVDIRQHSPSPINQSLRNSQGDMKQMARPIPIQPSQQQMSQSLNMQLLQQQQRQQQQTVQKATEPTKKKKRVKKLIDKAGQQQQQPPPFPQQAPSEQAQMFIKSSTPNPNARQPSVTPGILEYSIIEGDASRASQIIKNSGSTTQFSIKSKQVQDTLQQLDNIYTVPKASRSPSLIASGNPDVELVKAQNFAIQQELLTLKAEMQQGQQEQLRSTQELIQQLTTQLSTQISEKLESSSEKQKAAELNGQYDWLQQQLAALQQGKPSNAQMVSEIPQKSEIRQVNNASQFVQGTSMTIDETAPSYYPAKPGDLSIMQSKRQSQLESLQKQMEQLQRNDPFMNTVPQGGRVKFADEAGQQLSVSYSEQQSRSEISQNVANYNYQPTEYQMSAQKTVKQQQSQQVRPIQAHLGDLEERIQQLAYQLEQQQQSVRAPQSVQYKSLQLNRLEDEVTQLRNDITNRRSEAGNQQIETQQITQNYQLQFENQQQQIRILSNQLAELSNLLLINQKQSTELANKSAQNSLLSEASAHKKQQSAQTSMMPNYSANVTKLARQSSTDSNEGFVHQNSEIAKAPTFLDFRTAEMLNSLQQSNYSIPRRSLKEITRFLFADGY